MQISEKSPELEYPVPFKEGDVWKVTLDDIGIWVETDKQRPQHPGVASNSFSRFINCTIYFCIINVKSPKEEKWREQFSSEENSELLYTLTILTDQGILGTTVASGGKRNWQLVSRYGL